jgi:hypothetical protein
MEFGLSKSEARKQARALASERAAMLKARDRKRLQALRGQVKEAKRRKREAMKRARTLCKLARRRVRERVKELRASERQRLNQIVTELRTTERAACRARKARVKAAGGSVELQRRRLLLEEQRTQQAMRRAERRAALQVRTSSRERQQESDERVRNNLPPELRPLWDRFKGDFKNTKRATRTEAFLEWAEANPEEVIRMQSDQADRDVERLVREQQRLQRKLSKPKSYAVGADDVATLVAMGLAPNQVAARRRAPALSMPPPF